jgi:uncharacterized protein YjiS (DUF1127 family)
MSDWYSEPRDFQSYVAQAQEARAEAMARVGYLGVAAVGRALQAAGTALTTAVRTAPGAVRAWRNRQAALRQLLLLDDRLLKDIGLSRADIWAAVDGTLGNRTLQPATLQPADYVDIALSNYALGGCNDNGDRRQAA